MIEEGALQAMIPTVIKIKLFQLQHPCHIPFGLSYEIPTTNSVKKGTLATVSSFPIFNTRAVMELVGKMYAF